MSDVWQQRAGSFDARAAQYDAVRPSYPDDAIRAIMRFGLLQPGAHALEIGCGTGKATRLFVEQGLRITAVEPGAQMIEVARAASGDTVQFYNGSFEDWPLEAAGYDLVFAGQSFHWVNQETGYAKAGKALRRGGTLALFWNRTQLVPSALQDRLTELYAQRAPGLLELSPEVIAALEIAIGKAIRATELFDETEMVQIPWSERLPTERYIALLETQSAHAVLPADERRELLQAVESVVDEEGGTFETHYETVVHLARRA